MDHVTDKTNQILDGLRKVFGPKGAFYLPPAQKASIRQHRKYRTVEDVATHGNIVISIAASGTIRQRQKMADNISKTLTSLGYAGFHTFGRPMNEEALVALPVKKAIEQFDSFTVLSTRPEVADRLLRELSMIEHLALEEMWRCMASEPNLAIREDCATEA